jgi:hypothetical protein
MAVHGPLNAFSFDMWLVEIGREIELLEHFRKSLDHPVCSSEIVFFCTYLGFLCVNLKVHKLNVNDNCNFFLKNVYLISNYFIQIQIHQSKFVIS